MKAHFLTYPDLPPALSTSWVQVESATAPSLLENFFVIPLPLSCFACAHLPPGAHRVQAASFRDQCLHYSKACQKRNVHAVKPLSPTAQAHSFHCTQGSISLNSKNSELVMHAPEAFRYQSQTCLEVRKINVKLPLPTCPRTQHDSLQAVHT